MDGPTQPSEPSRLQLAAAITNLAPDNAIVAYCGKSVERSVARIDELAATAAAKKRLADVVSADALRLGIQSTQIADLQLVSAESDGLLARLDARQLAFERGIRQNLRLARDFARDDRAHETFLQLPMLPRRFANEQACVDYLCHWRQRRGFACEKCENDKYYPLSSRHVLECASCAAQTSVRAGTMFEKSRLKLRSWFAAIQAVLARPQVTSAALADHLGLVREETARKLKFSIRKALESPDRATLLARLDTEFAPQPVLGARGAHLTADHRLLDFESPETQSDE